RQVAESLEMVRGVIGEELAPGVPVGVFLKGVEVMIVELQQQLREVSLTLTVDRQQHRLAGELDLSPKPGSSLAGFFQYAGTARSRFQSLGQRAGLSLFVHFPPASSKASWMRDLQEKVFEKFSEQLDPRYLEIFPPVMDFLASTLAADGLDAFLSFSRAPAGADSLVLFGLKVQKGRKLDHLLRDTYRGLPTAERSGIAVAWNHARHANACIHRLKVPADDEDACVAIRDDVVFLGIGKQPLRGVQQGLDHFGPAQVAPVTTPLLQFDLAPAAFLSEEQYVKALPKGAAVDREKVRLRLSLQGGTRLRLRVETHSHVLPLLPAL